MCSTVISCIARASTNLLMETDIRNQLDFLTLSKLLLIKSNEKPFTEKKQQKL